MLLQSLNPVRVVPGVAPSKLTSWANVAFTVPSPFQSIAAEGLGASTRAMEAGGEAALNLSPLQ